MSRKQTASEIYADRELLERIGYGLLDIPSSSGVGFEDVRNFSYVQNPEQHPHFYRNLLRHLTGKLYPDELSRVLWQKLLEYRAELNEKTGQEVDLETAARDFFQDRAEACIKEWCLRRPEQPPVRLNSQLEVRLDSTNYLSRLVFPGLRDLLALGFGLPAIARASWRQKPPATGGLLSRLPLIRILRLQRATREKYYVGLVADLTGHPCRDYAQVEYYWKEVADHREYLAASTGKPEIPVQQAALDYFLRLNLMERIQKGDPLQ